MPVEITILSGQRQGERIELAANSFEVGDLATDAVRFDATADPDVTGHRASLRLEDGGWRIRSTGTLPIIVNHDPIERPHALRSGDIVRMSENGPDFSFALINRLSANPTAIPTVKPAAAAPAAPAEASPKPAVLSESRSLPTKIWAAAIAAVLGLGCASWFALVALRPGDSEVTSTQSPWMAVGPTLSIDEGQELLWVPEVHNSEGAEGLVFSLSAESPEGMQIDRQTGAIRWTPSELQAPGEYACHISMDWSHGSQQHKSGTILVCKAREVNQAPTLELLPPQTLNVLQGDSLDLVAAAKDLDFPAQRLTYHLGPDASGMQIDAASGKVTWTPNESFANQSVTVPISVTDNGEPPLTTTGELRVVVVSPDPWKIAADQVRPSVYLVGVQPPGSQTVLPLGSACAIDANTLLTSATVAAGLEEGRRRGWKVGAINSTKLQDFQASFLEVTDIMAHVGWVKSEDAEAQLFFDLGLLKAAGGFESTCQLATAEALADLAAQPQSLGCIGFELTGGPLARFDLPSAELKHVQLYSVIALPGPDGAAIDAPPLLQLSGELPVNPFGSPIITRDGKVVGVYAARAELPSGSERERIHYAPVVTLVSAWLAGEGRSHWIKPEPAQATPLSPPNNKSN